MNIVKQFVESAKSTSDMQDRLTYIMNLTSLDRTEFYSADVGLPGGAMNSLRSCGVVSRVPGKEKDAQRRAVRALSLCATYLFN